MVIQKLLRYLPAHPLFAAFVCSLSAVILSVPVFVAFNFLIPTRGLQAHLWGDVESPGAMPTSRSSVGMRAVNRCSFLVMR